MTVSDNQSGKRRTTPDLRGMIREVSREARRSPIPILIAAIAAFLALVSMANGESERLALGAHIESANQFAYFQAKNIRRTDAQIAAQMFEKMGHPDAANHWRQVAERYGKEKATILKAAKAHQVIRSKAMRQSGYFEIAIVLLQIAIVLATAALIAGRFGLIFFSVLLVFGAGFFTLNAYGLYYNIPTDPVEMLRGVGAPF
jgi:hypothetical protein